MCRRGCRSCRCENFVAFRDTLPCASSSRRPFGAPRLSEKFGRLLTPLSPCRSRDKSARLVRRPDISSARRRCARTNGSSIARHRLRRSRSTLEMPMKRERDTAIRTIARFAAIAAQQRSGKTAPIQKQNCLLAFFQTIGDGLRQFLGKNGGFLFLPSLLAQIDDAHERHLLLIHALRERNEPVFSGRRVVITLQRRRGAAQERPTHFSIFARTTATSRA